MITNSTILVTGGAGFIGSHIATRIAAYDSNTVIIFDDFSTGKAENIEHLKEKDNIKIIHNDIRNLNALDDCMNENDVDYVFHLAAIASVPLSIQEPLMTHEVNVTGTLNILHLAKEYDIKKVVFSSSAAVYGEEPTLPKVESMPTQPKSPYAVTKIASEDYLRVFYQTYNLPTVSLRYFNVFGPRQDPNSQYAAAVPIFVQRLLNNERPIIYGDGEQTRDFVFVADVVNANITAAVSENANGEIFNIAGGAGTSINQLVKMITELSGSELEAVFESERPGDIKYSYADTTKAREVLGWEPKIKLNDGLKQLIEKN